MNQSEYESLLKHYNVDGTVEVKKPTAPKKLLFFTESRTCDAHKAYQCGKCKIPPEAHFNFKYKKVYFPLRAPETEELTHSSFVYVPPPKPKTELKYEPYSGSKYY